jgi:hypothetical protein
VSGQAIGVSEFKPVERLFYEMNTFRGLRLDALLMSILPVFVKAREGGMKELEKNLIAGLIIEGRPENVAQLTKTNVDPAIFREGSELKNDIDEALGTMPNLRGKESAPRVPASSSERAFNSTFARVKDRVIEFEGEMSQFAPNSLFLCYQFWPTEHRVRVGGGEPPLDPFVTYKREDLLEALDADYAFRGARTALDSEMQVQNMKEVFTIMINAQLPHFKANIFAEDLIDLTTKAGNARRYMMSDKELQEMQAEQPPAEEGAPAGPQGPPGAPPAEEAPPA